LIQNLLVSGDDGNFIGIITKSLLAQISDSVEYTYINLGLSGVESEQARHILEHTKPGKTKY
jgi:hypothetical protein